MRKHLFLGILLLIVCGVQAQHITRNYNKTSLPHVLTDIDNASQRYTINFIYRDLCKTLSLEICLYHYFFVPL